MRQRILRWLKAWKERRDVRRYIKGYQRHPQSVEEWKAIEQVQVEALAKEVQDPPWDQPPESLTPDRAPKRMTENSGGAMPGSKDKSKPSTQCCFCRSHIEEEAIKCLHCGEHLRGWRAPLDQIQKWSSVVALLGLIVAFRGLKIAEKELSLKYHTQISVVPVALTADFNRPGEDASQVWTTVVLKATNDGTIAARDTKLTYRIGAPPCRNYFTNTDIESYTGEKRKPFDIPGGESRYFLITFTDARTCVQDYLARKKYLEVEVEATFQGMDHGKDATFPYSSKWRSNGNQFRPL